jgi:hypothetical protein
MTGLTLLLAQRLRREGMEDVRAEARTVNVPGGQLAAVYVVAYPKSLPDERKVKLEKITLDECVSYLQAAYNSKTSTENQRAPPSAESG